jgi:20S proteasome subunit alpha 7
MRSLHQVHDEEKEFELELGWVCEESGRQFQRVPTELADEANRAAKDALEAEDM